MRLWLPAAALLAWAAGGWLSVSHYRSTFPPPTEIRVQPEGAAGDMFALAFGARRLFADVWFIRLLQYYGTPELEGAKGEGGELAWLLPPEKEEAEDGHHHHHHNDEIGLNGEGNYPQFLYRSLHILQIDPYFTAAGLYGAASLAFNMNRASEAEELLRYALKYQPREWKLLNVLTAIGYSKARNPSAVAETIAPLLKDPDCPVMLKQLAAFLNKKAGNFAAAAAIYADIAATSHDEAYVRNARKELQILSRRKPARS